MNNETVVIVGAGQAGGELARNLRNGQFPGNIVLIGEETFAPYERPPLSKGVLLDKGKFEDCQLFKNDQINDLNIDFRGSTQVTQIDREQQKVHTNHGERLAYNYLVIATGGYARTLPDKLVSEKVEKDRVLTLRSMADALKLKERLVENSRVLIVGGGWLGLEIAASGSQLGCEMTVIEFADRLCARVLPKEISSYLLELHNNNGINVYLNTGLEYIGQEDVDRLTITTTTGQSVSADLVIVCIGLAPNAQLASDAGLAVDNGICTSPDSSTEDPAIFAIGDVARYTHEVLNESVRLESWENANMMAQACAQKILGQSVDKYDLPWFWSDQHNANIQVVGLPNELSQAVLRGDISSNQFCYFYLDKTDHINAVVAVNSAREISIAKRLIRSGVKVSASQIMDQSLKLNVLLKQNRP